MIFHTKMRKFVNIGKLISLVENYPILWDCRRLDLATKLKKQQVWIGIGRNMLPNFDQCTQSKQDKYVNQLKSKWKEVYTEHRKCKLKRKHYRFAHLLKFIDVVLDVLGQNSLPNNLNHANDKVLAPCLNHAGTQIKEEVMSSEPVPLKNSHSIAETSINIVKAIKTENEFDNDIGMVKVEIIKEMETNESKIPSSGERSDQPNYITVGKSAPTVMPVESAASHLNERLVNSVKSASPDDLECLDVQVRSCRSCATCDGRNADRQWLLSLEPDYKNLTAEQKLDFRIQCLQFFRTAMKRPVFYDFNREIS